MVSGTRAIVCVSVCVRKWEWWEWDRWCWWSHESIKLSSVLQLHKCCSYVFHWFHVWPPISNLMISVFFRKFSFPLSESLFLTLTDQNSGQTTTWRRHRPEQQHKKMKLYDDVMQLKMSIKSVMPCNKVRMKVSDLDRDYRPMPCTICSMIFGWTKWKAVAVHHTIIPNSRKQQMRYFIMMN